MSSRLSVIGFVLYVASMPCAFAETAAVPNGTPFAPEYQREFGRCDAENKFEDAVLPIYSKKIDPKTHKHKILWYPCDKHDKNNFARFEKIDANGAAPAAFIVVSKLDHDDDGSRDACDVKRRGTTSQCRTSMKLNATDKYPCRLDPEGKPGKRCVPVDADDFPYIVIPAAAPLGAKNHEFEHRTGVAVGDYAVAIADGHVVPAVVADTGPAYKIGEGSSALLKKLSGSPRHTYADGVTFIIFPGTRDKIDDLSADTFADVIREKGQMYYDKLTGKH